MENKFEKVITHLQTTGYVFQGSQIYGGLANTWDYGPLEAKTCAILLPIVPAPTTKIVKSFISFIY